MTTPLDEHVAFLERHVEQLDEVVRDLAGRLDGLRDELDALRRQLRSEVDRLEGGSALPAPEDDVPPHWGGRTHD